MMQSNLIRLRAVEPSDIEWIYRWENDPTIWAVSGTLVPFSRHTLSRLLDEQQFDLLQTRQQRLMIESRERGEPIGALDLFELDMIHRRMGVGILIAEAEDRRRGYAADAVQLICRYAKEVLGLHQVWCNVAADNEASLALFARCGFAEAGRKRDWLREGDGWKDEIMMQILL